MNWFDDIIRQIRQEDKIENLKAANDVLLGDNNQLTVKIKGLNDIIYEANKDKIDQAMTIKQLRDDKDSLTVQLITANTGIDKLKTELALTGEILTPDPEFMDLTKTVYTPYQRLEGEDLYLVPCEPYDEEWAIKYWIRQNNIRILSKNQKLIKIWDWVIKQLTYKLDSQVDNWQFACQTLHRAKGDCEDGVILFIKACKLAGIRPDEVFNAIGECGNFGLHSYPIIKFDKDETLGTDGESWYICETTLDSMPISGKPKKLLRSIYKTESYGLANWKFYGRIKPEFTFLFNFAGPAGLGEDKRILNSEEKRKQIQDYWNEVD